MAVLAVAATLAAGPVEAAVYTVGGDGACSHPSIEAALLAAIFNSGADEIRLATNRSYTGQGFVIQNQSVTIRGGYSSCSDTTASSSGTTLNGAGGGVEPIIEISRTTGGLMNVVLENLKLVDGDSDGITITGTDIGVTLDNVDVDGSADDGIRITNTNRDVQLDDVLVTDSGSQGVRVSGASARLFVNGSQITFNAATGLWAENGAAVSVDVNTLIANNTGSGGAGVRCIDAEMDLLGPVFNNTATTTGGGIRAEGSCNMDVSSTNSFGSIFTNTANVNGGGLYAVGGAYVRINGHHGGAWIHQNRASNVGGAIYVAGSGTLVEIANANIEDNSAGFAGGAIYATDGAEVISDRVGSTCRDPYRCMTISDNSIDSSGNGSAVFVGLGADVTMLQTFVENHGPGYLLYADGTGSRLELETVQLWNNQAGSLFQIESGAALVAAFVSAADNGIGVLDSRLVQGTGGSVELYSSVFRDVSGAATSGGSLIADCIIADDTGGLPVSAYVVQAADPAFVNESSGDLHLLGSSPAIDFCDTFNFAPTQADMDFETRGWDNPGVTNYIGTYDLGIDESMAVGGLPFSDGFESGDVSAWSSSVP